MSILMGSLLGFAILIQSVQIAVPAKDNQEQASEDSNKEVESTISQAEAIPGSSSQITLGFDSYLLDEVNFKEVEDENRTTTNKIVASTSKAFRVLLRKIISPNAP